VYVVREGLRFWKFDALDALFERRMTSLAEVEQIVADACHDNAEGKLENDRYRKQLARQGDALLERVGQARKLYQELKRVEETERRLRGSTK
jgi:regulator of replication initiation timing